MSTPPTIPPPSGDPAGAAPLHMASAAAIVTAAVLYVLQRYVWPGQVPEQVAWTVYPVASYVVSQLSARFVRRRRLACQQGPAGPPAS